MEPATIFLGIAASAAVQAYKQLTGLSGVYVTWFAIGIAMLTAVLYALAMNLGYGETIWQVLTTAGAFYAFIVRQFER